MGQASAHVSDEHAPAMTGKVVGFVTRPSPTRVGELELLVFHHQLAGVQLPAGSLHDGEDPVIGGPREVFEETGLGTRDVDVVREIGTWIEPESGLTRHAYHYRCLRETPDQWWVVTPDGGGLCWRCHWVRLDGTEAIHPAQRPWLDRVRHRIDDGPRPLREWQPLPAELDGGDTADVFVALDDQMRWYSSTWLPGPIEGGDDQVTQAMALPVTDDGGAVIVTHKDGGDHIPGGTREHGEELRQTLERELYEEACARVLDATPLGVLRNATRDADGAVVDVHHGSRWWARVELDPWLPEWEMVERRVTPYTDVLGALPAWRHPGNERWITAAIEAERCRRR